MNFIIIGTGMYVSGRSTDGYGTILPAIIEWKRNGGDLDKVLMSGTNRKHSIEALEKIKKLQEFTGVSIQIDIYPYDKEIDKHAYKHALDSIEKPACAIVAVPDHLHYDITKACLEAELHTLVVKPLTPTVKEAMELIGLAEKKKLYGAVEFHKRWDRQNLLLRDSFKSGQLGELLYTWTEYSQRKSIPTQIFKSWVEKTNIFQYLGVHYVDIIHFVTSAIPLRVMALGQKNCLIKQGINSYDSIQCIVEWQLSNGKTFSQTLLVNWVDPENTNAMSDQKINVVGTKGRFEANQKDRGIQIVTDDQPLESINPDFCRQYTLDNGNTVWQGYGIESIKTFLNDVNSIIEGEITPLDLNKIRPSFEQALVSISVIETVKKSLQENGHWVKINNKQLIQ